MKSFRTLSFLLCLCLLSALMPPALALEAPSITAAAVVLADFDSGNILYEKNMNVQRSPASLTKIMTGLLAVEAVERGEIALEDIVTAPPDCWTGLDADSSNAEISPGEKMTFEDYLYCALVKSANEACNVIAVAVSGNLQSFISRMNTRAMELGANNTYFSDTNGLSSENHYTTARDLFLISREAMRHELFVQIVDTQSYTIAPTNMYRSSRVLKNSNALICQNGVYGDKYLYSGASGVKTGYTSAAGYCLVSTAEKKGVHLLAVLLGCNGLLNTGDERYGNFTGTIALYDWGFRNFAYRTVLSNGDPVQQFPVQFAKGNASVTLRSTQDVSLLIPKDTPKEAIELSVHVNYGDLVAPIEAGTILGSADILINGNLYATVSLATASGVERDKREYLHLRLQEAFSEPWIKTAAAAVLGVICFALMMILRYRALRNRHIHQRLETENRRQRDQERMENLARSREAQEEMMQFRSSSPSRQASSAENHYRISSADPSRRTFPQEELSSLFSEEEDPSDPSGRDS